MKNEIIIGDCADVLKKFDSESIDCIVTDPPYGYSFMGLSWDKALPSIEALKECNRVLKSGAFGFFMCAPRMDVLWRMGQRLEEAGFRVDFSFIGWAFASGFPKSMSISKAIDKKAGSINSSTIAIKKEIKSRYKSTGMTLKDFNKACGFEASGYLRTSSTWESVLPDSSKWAIIKSVLGCNDELDELFKSAEREVISNGKCGKTAIMGGIQGKQTTGGSYDITAPATDKAREFSGAFASFQPKPALEVIIVCMKNLSEKTYVDQALQNGHGCTWLGDCKIPYESDADKEFMARGWSENSGKFEGERTLGSNVYGSYGTNTPPQSEDGRFPANLLVSDSCLDNGIIHKSGTFKGVRKAHKDICYGKYNESVANFEKNEGQFSRYFSLDAWFDKKLQELPEEQQKTFPFLITPKPSKSEKNKYIENKHPTVKPLKLMSYLITMGSREGDLILDPFAGSGTTLEACKLLNRRFVGIDLDPENEKYMRARGQLESPTLEAFVK